MDNTLIVTSSDKGVEYFADALRQAGITQVLTVVSGGEARRRLLERSFDLVVIDFPLQDESGEDLARHISANGVAQVILVVPSQFYDAISNLCEDDGVLVISKPINKKILWLTLKLARSVHARLALLRTENLKLKQRVEDIRLASRAKWLLVSYLGVSEPEAHRHIEKQAMDLRLPKRVIAEGIIKTYENL